MVNKPLLNKPTLNKWQQALKFVYYVFLVTLKWKMHFFVSEISFLIFVKVKDLLMFFEMVKNAFFGHVHFFCVSHVLFQNGLNKKRAAICFS